MFSKLFGFFADPIDSIEAIPEIGDGIIARKNKKKIGKISCLIDKEPHVQHSVSSCSIDRINFSPVLIQKALFLQVPSGKTEEEEELFYCPPTSQNLLTS